MHKIIKQILNKIENVGYEAYVIGGYVRDLLVGISSYDIDICTNATPKELMMIFPNASSKNLGGIDFKVKEYHIEITTYREEIKYKNRKPIEFNYINNLVKDLERRDFTINAICMNSQGEIIDLVGGIEDLSNLKVKMIGDPTFKIKEDPLRILRAIRLATHLNFNLDSPLYKAIEENSQLILELSNVRIKEELDKILLSNHVKKGLNLLNELGITNLLNISGWQNIIPVKNLEGMYAQIKINYNIPFTKEEKSNITSIRRIINSNELDKFTIYNYGLYLSLVDGEILNMDKKTINKIYKSLPIHDKKEINIKADKIINIIGSEHAKKISIILKDIENLIINGKIRNKTSDIEKYIKEHKSEWII